MIQTPTTQIPGYYHRRIGDNQSSQRYRMAILDGTLEMQIAKHHAG